MAEPLATGNPVALQLDCFHLDYFTSKIHFAGHHVAIYGHDETHAYLVDTRQQGSRVKTTLERLAKARAERGPMAAKNRTVTVSFQPADVDVDAAIRRGIRRNAEEFLNPPITNLGHKGIKRTASEILKWHANSADPAGEFGQAAVMMEKAGTGGALFRNLYRDFLREAGERLHLDCLKTGHERFAVIAAKWTEIAGLFADVGESGSAKPLERAAVLFKALSELERNAMQDLAEGVGAATAG